MVIMVGWRDDPVRFGDGRAFRESGGTDGIRMTFGIEDSYLSSDILRIIERKIDILQSLREEETPSIVL